MEHIILAKIIVNVVTQLVNANHWLQSCQTVKSGCDLRMHIFVAVQINVQTLLQMCGGEKLQARTSNMGKSVSFLKYQWLKGQSTLR